ncbi:MAG TPA: TlpA disulfide reductase family protein [Chitinophagaceae bacterium]|nr:TlpA disulfide reductase family protein [Chitinophagaceae bacterium]
MKHLTILIFLGISIFAAAQNKKGKPLPDISLPNPMGTEVPVSSLKGKVVLVDFWASWCKPCRNNNPKLVGVYEKFKEKGFEIYAVSIDENKGAWVSAVAEDKMFWTNVVDTKGWRSTVLSTFNVQAIPSNLLIDKKGMIRGYDVAPEHLDKMINNLLAEL